jgi:hypothetical protein
MPSTLALRHFVNLKWQPLYNRATEELKIKIQIAMFTWIWRKKSAIAISGPVDQTYGAFEEIWHNEWYGRGTLTAAALPPQPAAHVVQEHAASRPRPILAQRNVVAEGGLKA